MGQLQESFDRSIDGLPRVALEQVIRRKLEEAGVGDDALASRIADEACANDDDRIEIGPVVPIDLAFTEADHKEVQRASEAFLEKLPDFVGELTEDVGQAIAEDFKEQWSDRAEARALEATSLRKRIASKWSRPFESLGLLIALCAQEGEDFNVAHLRSKRGCSRDQALARLHIRACRVADEIMLLLENGHTEGAQGRWRTLHEVVVTATLIAEGGDDLADRYFAHEAVERRRMLEDHRRAEALSEPNHLPRPEAREIERAFRGAVSKYGQPFQGMYGWASGQLGLPTNPHFHHLQETAGSLAQKLRYRIACFDTHASARALAQPLHNWDPTTHIPGAFEAGFDGPAIDTANSLVQVTLLLFREPWDLDRMATMIALGRLHDGAVRSFGRVARRIERDESRDLERVARGAVRPFGYVKRRPVSDQSDSGVVGSRPGADFWGKRSR